MESENEPYDSVAVRLGFMADMIRSWLNWHSTQRANDGLTTDDGTNIMALPAPMWPTHGQLQAWIDTLKQAEKGRLAHQRPQGEVFQGEVDRWMDACFGAAIKADRLERADRFIEEALELCQTEPTFTADRAHALVDYVFGREVGEPVQEVGGVMVTLAALCNTFGIDVEQAAQTELARVWTKVEQIRAKQAAKPTGSALPIAHPAPEPAGELVERMARAMAAAEGLVWDEVCGHETDADECDSGTCTGAQTEDHDPDWTRSIYLRLAKAALAALRPDDAREENAKLREARKYQLGDRLTKRKGSSWTGRVVGFYSTSLTPIGYAIESENEPGSVQIYPENALTPKGETMDDKVTCSSCGKSFKRAEPNVRHKCDCGKVLSYPRAVDAYGDFLAGMRQAERGEPRPDWKPLPSHDHLRKLETQQAGWDAYFEGIGQ